jgi:ATP synthase protein I
MRQPDALQAKRVLAIQLAATLGLAALGTLVSASVGLSALIGAGTGTLANAMFAFWVFGRYGAQDPGLLLMRFYGAEILKVALILAAFVAAFVYIEGLHIPTLLGAFFVVQVVPALLASQPGTR